MSGFTGIARQENYNNLNQHFEENLTTNHQANISLYMKIGTKFSTFRH